MHRLSTIALALGEERTRTELIPFLEEVTQEDEDEVLTVLAEELGNFIPYIGGPEYAHILLNTLESLSAMEEPLVRDKAVESLNKIIETQSREQIENYFVELIKTLSGTEWFSSRVSATGLFATVVKKLDKNPALQDELLSLYKALCQDEAPMVRRAAATNLPGVINAIPDAKFEGSIYSMFQSQVNDDQDSVRLLSVNVLIAIAEALKKQNVTKYNSELITLANTLFTDKSWRVRYMASSRFEDLAVALDSPQTREKFVPDFVSLMKDSEAEVRTAIAKQIPGFSKLIPRDVILSEIIPSVEVLSRDPSQHVRAALASEISRLAPLLGKEMTNDYLLPTFLLMLKDEFPDVRLNIISKLQVVNDVIGIERLSKSLLPAISDLAKDKQWRVRLAIIQYIPLLAEQLGVSFFDRELGPLCMTWLWDNVYSIREAATLNLKKLAEVFGLEWAKQEIIPHIIVVGATTNYLYRLTVLFAVSTLIPVVDMDTINESILPFLGNLMNDPIPNIRFSIAKTYKVLVSALLKPEYPDVSEEKKIEEGEVDADGDQSLSDDKSKTDSKDKSSSEEDKKRSEEDAEELKKKKIKEEEDREAEIPRAPTLSLKKKLPLGPRADLPTIRELLDKTVIPNLEKLAEDQDVDVRYFANKSLEEIDELVREVMETSDTSFSSATQAPASDSVASTTTASGAPGSATSSPSKLNTESSGPALSSTSNSNNDPMITTNSTTTTTTAPLELNSKKTTTVAAAEEGNDSTEA